MAPRPELCVGGVVIHDGRLLLIQRATDPGAGQWSLPGGRVESGETMEAAVAREVHEETGLRVRVGELVGWVERIDPAYHFVIFDFAAEPLEAAVPERGPVELQPGDDAADGRWVDLADVGELNVVSGLAEFLDQHGVTPPRTR